MVNSGDLVLAPTGSDFCMTAHHIMISVHFHWRRTTVTMVLHQPVTYPAGRGREPPRLEISTISNFSHRQPICMLNGLPAGKCGHRSRRYLLYLYPRVEESGVLCKLILASSYLMYSQAWPSPSSSSSSSLPPPPPPPWRVGNVESLSNRDRKKLENLFLKA